MFDAPVRRALGDAGYTLSARPQGTVAVWGRGRLSRRLLSWAALAARPVLHLEEPFLAGLGPVARRADPRLGLLIDRRGPHFDGAHPTELEAVLSSTDIDDAALRARARDAMAWQRLAHLSKYAATLPDLPLPDPGFALVVLQHPGDAALRAAGPPGALARRMIAAARAAHPGAEIIVKPPPGGRCPVLPEGVRRIDGPVSPWALLERAAGVFTVSSLMGFEAICAGLTPEVFGQPFYAGWGLSRDHGPPLPRRARPLTAETLYAGAMILFPRWIDPYAGTPCELETILAGVEARARAWREDHGGYRAYGLRLWKRRPVGAFLGGRVRHLGPQGARRALVWGARPAPAGTGPVVRLEDGFLRSRGLGAALVPALSMIADPTGLHYDPNTRSAVETAIARAPGLPARALARAAALRGAMVAAGLSKYSLDADPPPPLPDDRQVVIVAGQVADDASVRLGCTGAVSDTGALLRAARAARPDACLVYKPHPDVEAGLRSGGQIARDALALANVIATTCDPARLLTRADEVWTLTSGLGLEALLRGVPVVCAGLPVYAGWGLTTDLVPGPDRRRCVRGVSRDALVHALFIDAPRYHDPVSGLACPPEVAVARLSQARAWRGGLALRLLAKAQGAAVTVGLSPGFWRPWRG